MRSVPVSSLIAERIAEKWGVTRDDCDRFGLLSQERAQRANEAFAAHPVSVAVSDEEFAAEKARDLAAKPR